MMKYTMPVTKDMVCASSTMPISLKAAEIICKKINRMEFERAKKFMESLVAKKSNINGKFYTKAAKKIFELLNAAEFNAKAKNIGPEKMEIIISAHKGPTLYRGRRKRSFGLSMKISHLQIILRNKIGASK